MHGHLILRVLICELGAVASDDLYKTFAYTDVYKRNLDNRLSPYLTNYGIR
jgi:hypothetical protein